MAARAGLSPKYDWEITPREAIALQRRLAPRVERQNRLGPNGARGVRLVAGVDVAFADAGRTTIAAIVVMRLPGLETVETATARLPTRFPYIPGLLSFREVPAILEAFRKLKCAPDLLLCDGQGYAHPRRFGLACHVGLIADLPAIGIGKSRLIGRHAEPGPARGDHAALFDDRPTTGKPERIGAVLRTRSGVKPLYVSIGHRVSLRGALALTMRCLGRFRLPEPVRLADKLSKSP